MKNKKTDWAKTIAIGLAIIFFIAYLYFNNAAQTCHKLNFELQENYINLYKNYEDIYDKYNSTIIEFAEAEESGRLLFCKGNYKVRGICAI